MVPSRLPAIAPSVDTTQESFTLTQRTLGVACGTVFSLALFLGIAHFKPGAEPSAADPVDDLQVVVLPEPPPPPPRAAPKEPETTAALATGFDFSPSDSAVKIAASPSALAPPPEALSLPPPPAVTITAPPRAALSLAFDPRRIFQRSEVDQRPFVVERSNPYVPRTVRGSADSLSVTLLCVINADGTVGSVNLARSSGKPRFDELMAEELREWKFFPAIKDGRKVRCLAEQPITIRWASGSPFL